jgi:hypothetical protein
MYLFILTATDSVVLVCHDDHVTVTFKNSISFGKQNGLTAISQTLEKKLLQCDTI